MLTGAIWAVVMRQEGKGNETNRHYRYRCIISFALVTWSGIRALIYTSFFQSNPTLRANTLHRGTRQGVETIPPSMAQSLLTMQSMKGWKSLLTITSHRRCSQLHERRQHVDHFQKLESIKRTTPTRTPLVR